MQYLMSIICFSTTQFTLAVSDTYFAPLNPANEAQMVTKYVFTLVANDWHSFDAAAEYGFSVRYIHVYITEMPASSQYIGFNEIEAYAPLDFGKIDKSICTLAYGLDFVSRVDYMFSKYFLRIIMLQFMISY